MPCTKSELDLDSMLPLQIGMVNVYLVQTSPKLGPDGGGPLEFQILSSGDDYQDLSHCYLYLKCQVLKANGLPIKSAKFTGWEATFWAHEPVVPFPVQTSGPGDEQHTGSNQWGHLPVWGLPDHAGRLRLPGQENLAKAPGRLGHGRGRNLQCAGKLRLGPASEESQEQ